MSRFSQALITKFQNFAIPLVFGLIAYLLVLGPHALNPHNIGWLQDGDPAQHYLGWEFFRRAPWTFPVGLSQNFGMSVASSIVYTDSIPLFAISLKIFRNYFGGQFQYLGLWILICFCLQAYFSLKIARLLIADNWAQLLVMVLLVFSPTMMGRFTFETSLSSHFLFLASIYLILIGLHKKTDAYWIFLLVAAALIHFYLFSAVAIIWLCDAIDRHRSAAITYQLTSYKSQIVTVIVVSLCMWQAGYFAISLSSSSPGGYGDNPINLLTLFDAKGWSYFFKSWAPYDYHSSDDLNFLGVGILFLMPFALIGIYRSRVHIQTFLSQHKYVALGCMALTIFAISNHVHVGQYEWSFPLPSLYLKLAGILRASARMFWLVYYVIVFGIIFGVILGMPKKWVSTLFACAALIQVFDTSAGWLRRKEALSAGTNLSVVEPYTSMFWNQAAKKYTAIVKILTQDNVAIKWDQIARYALRFNLPTNSVYLSRTDANQFRVLNSALEKMVLSGKYNPDHLYFLDRNKVIPALAHLQPNDILAQIDGAAVLAPNWKNCTECLQPTKGQLLESIMPFPKLGTPFIFDRSAYGTNPYVLNMGWEFPEEWGTWSNGPQAQMTLPLPKNAKSLVLTARALVTPAHTTQTVQILVNDSWSAIYELKSDRHNEVLIPITEKMMTDRYVQIWFIFHNAARPINLGMGKDNRELALGLISGKFQ